MKKLAVVGGGPVGLFLSIRISELGYDIDVFEKNDWPRDKTCGQGIMPSGVSLLEHSNIKFIDGEDSYFFDSIYYIDGELKVKGLLKEKGFGVERKVISNKLYERAKEARTIRLIPQINIDDIEILPNKKIKLLKDEEKIYDYVFVCDGLNSLLREKLGCSIFRKENHRMAARQHFIQKPWSRSVEVYWKNGIEAYVTPINENKIELAFLWYENRIEKGAHLFERLIREFPTLRKKLKFEEIVNDFKGYGPFNKKSKCIKVDNVFFVGDAYCFLDGITGEGISLGFKAADVIAKNFEKFTLMSKLKIKVIYWNYTFWVRVALFLSRYPKVRKKLLRILSWNQKLFGIILKFNDIKII